MHHILLVEEEGAEIRAAGGQHGFVCLEVDPIYDKGAVTQQALLTLAVELLQNFPAVPRELHRTMGVRMVSSVMAPEESARDAIAFVQIARQIDSLTTKPVCY